MPLTEHQKALNQRYLLELRIDLLLRWLLKGEALDSSNRVTTALMGFDEKHPFPDTQEKIYARLFETAQAYVETYPAEQRTQPKVEAYTELVGNASQTASGDFEHNQFIEYYRESENFSYFNPSNPNPWRAYFEAQVAQPGATNLTDVVLDQERNTRVLKTIELEDDPWGEIYNLDAIQACLGENFSITNEADLNDINTNPFADIKAAGGFPIVPMHIPGTDEIHFCKIKNGKICVLNEADAANVDAQIQARLKALLSKHGYQLPGEPMPVSESNPNWDREHQVKSVGKVRGEESGTSPHDGSGATPVAKPSMEGFINIEPTPGGVEELTIAAQSVDEGAATITGGDLSNQIQENYTQTQKKSIAAYNELAANINRLMKQQVIMKLDDDSQIDLSLNYSNLIDFIGESSIVERAFREMLSQQEAMEAFMRVAGAGVYKEDDDPENDVSEIILKDLIEDVTAITRNQKEANQSSVFSNKNQKAVEKQRGYQKEIYKWIEFGAKLAYYHSKNQAYPSPGPVFAYILSRIGEYNKFIKFEQMDDKSKIDSALIRPENALIVLLQYQSVKEISKLLRYFKDMQSRLDNLNAQASHPERLIVKSTSLLYTPEKFMNDYNQLAGELNIFISSSQKVYVDFNQAPEEIHWGLENQVALSDDDQSNMSYLLALSGTLYEPHSSSQDKLIAAIKLLDKLNNIAVEAHVTSTWNYFEKLLPDTPSSGAERDDMAPLLQRLFDMILRYPIDADKTWLSKQQKEVLKIYYPDNTTVRRFVGIDEPIARRDRTVEKEVELQDMAPSPQPDAETSAGSSSKRGWFTRFKPFSRRAKASSQNASSQPVQATTARHSGEHDDEAMQTTKADPMAGMNENQKALADEMMKRLGPHIKDDKLQKNVCDFVNNLKGGLLGTRPDDFLQKIKTKGQDLKQAVESAQMESWDNSRNWIVNKFAESEQQPKKKGWFR